MNHLVSRLLGGAALVGALSGAPAFAQGAPSVSRPVVQAVPGEDNKKLSAALARLGRDSRDVAALIDAGDAARALQDSAAAIGFYRRADEVSPGNPRVQAGLGSAFVHNGDPVSAIPYFDAAEKAGAGAALIAADRGLAYDLVGDNALAQRYYAAAMTSASGDKADELRHRLAISQAIGGDVDAAYTTLLPLLNRQDKPGWRTRAFTLAIAGDADKAVEITNTILPGKLAQSIAPYLRYMPRLTRAQQAAAADLGRFPRASEIGRDDARIAAYAPPRSSAAGGGLIPKGEPLGGTKLAKATKTSRTRSARTDTAQAARQQGQSTRPTSLASVDPDRVAPPEPKPAIERDTGELPPVGRSAEPARVAAATPAPVPGSASVSTPAVTPSAAPVRTAAPAPTQVAQATGPSTPPARSTAPGFDLGRLPASQAPAMGVAPASALAAKTPPVSAPASPPPVPGPNQLSLSEIFADIGKPTVDVMPTSGAVDIRLITPAAPPPPRVQLPKVEEAKPAEIKLAETKPVEAKAAEAPVAEVKEARATKAKTAAAKAAETKAKAKADAEAKAKAEAAEKAKKPTHPSRIWVQIGVGRDKSAIAFDWRRYTRDSAALLKGRSPYVSEMGRTNRVLIGPFATQKAASAFLADARKQGFADALPWTSPAGQVVDPLSSK
ncbi:MULTISPECIES: SPOR domain-containing protein [Sphingomonadaceae]|uniref:SPOR domain-containing protein n=1 Tax=Sphingomonadaceae TaxID=41297 RepID=UPI001E34BDB7|nr:MULTISPECIES: SPOR domain-containing protein [Sphingomonadaceae]